MRSNIFLVSLGLLWPTLGHSATLSNLSSILTSDDIHWSSNTVVAFPNSTAFFNATERSNNFGRPIFGASITPANEDDVVLAVKTAVKNNIFFLATGARHGTGLGYSKMDGGIAIDLSNFKAVEPHTNDSTVTIGGAAEIREFADQLSAAGLMLPGGSCSCPGYTGLAVGGGIGRYYGSLGLVADRMISARVVTATGDIVQASAEENADLFWGLRGAGANFGIILSATYQAVKKSDHSDGNVLTVDLSYSADKAPAYFALAESLADELPGNVAAIHFVRYNATVDQAELFANWVWFGPEEEGRDFIAQFINLEPYAVANYVYIQANELNGVAGNGVGQNEMCVPGIYANTYSSNQKVYTASVFQNIIDSLDDFYHSNPQALTSVAELSLFPNEAVASLGDDFNAYPWRDTKAFFSITTSYTDAGLQNQTLLDLSDQFSAALRDDWRETGGYKENGGACYINYSRGDESLQIIYGDKLPQLVELKKKWDPNNVFAIKNPIPTSLS
ncbi:putative secondary metabolism biosynthetic enzyme [Pestalotiopsis sp. IQ-011]